MSKDAPYDLIASTVAVLFDPSSAPQTPLEEQAIRAIIRPPLGIGRTLEGYYTLVSSRDQVEAIIAPNKIDIRDTNGRIEHGAEKIPAVLQGFLALMPGLQLKSYGVNFVVELEPEEPGKLLAHIVFKEGIFEKFGADLSSDSASVIFEKPPKRWTLRLQVLDGRRLNVNANASELATELPNGENLRGQIVSYHTDLIQYLKNLGL